MNLISSSLKGGKAKAVKPIPSQIPKSHPSAIAAATGPVK